MTDELKDYYDQLTEVMAEIRNMMTKEVPKLQGRLKIDKLEFAKNRIGRAKQLLKSIYVELRDVDKAEGSTYEMKAKELEQELTGILQDVNWTLTSAQNEQALAVGGVRKTDMNSMTAKDMTTEAKAIQDQSQASTARTKEVLQQTIELGTATAATLKAQGQQIQNVDKDLDTLDSNLNKASKQIRAYVRKLATDKIIVLMVLLVVLAIIAAILVPVLKPRADAAIKAVTGVFPTTV